MGAFSAVTMADLVVLLAAIVGVGGSFLLYRVRRIHEADRLRNALYAEVGKIGDEIFEVALRMESAKLVGEPYLPEESPIVVTAYENNAGELGRLTPGEIESLASFYTAAVLVDERLQPAMRSDDPSMIESLYLRTRLIELNNLNNAALDAIEARLDDVPLSVEYRMDLAGPEWVTIEEIREELGTDGGGR